MREQLEDLAHRRWPYIETAKELSDLLGEVWNAAVEEIAHYIETDGTGFCVTDGAGKRLAEIIRDKKIKYK